MNPENLVHIRVWGDFACFTRPEMKVERVSYPIMTPSAARGVLEAIFWEPQMYYLIQQITVLRHTVHGREYGKGKWVSFQRNEVCRTVSLRTIGQWMEDPSNFAPIMAGAGSGKGNIAQRNTLALTNVAYLVSAEINLSDLARQPRDNLAKYRDEFRRRAQSGKCHYRPSLGCREFSADFDWVAQPDILPRWTAGSQASASWSEKLGIMLYDVFHPEERRRGFSWFNPELTYAELGWDEPLADESKKQGFFGQPVKPRACFFQARIENSELKCHPTEVAILSARHSRGYGSATTI